MHVLDAVIENAIREGLEKPKGKLTKSDLEPAKSVGRRSSSFGIATPTRLS